MVLGLASDRRAVIVCTSNSRPAPTVGRPIYETDTLMWRYWNGSSWLPISDMDFIGLNGQGISGAAASPDRLQVFAGVLPGSTVTDGQGQIVQVVPFPITLLGVVWSPYVTIGSEGGSAAHLTLGGFSSNQFTLRLINTPSFNPVGGRMLGVPVPFFAWGR